MDNFIKILCNFCPVSLGKALIQKINPILKGWAYYHRHIVSSKVYSNIDHYIFLRLKRWFRRKHPKKSWKWINKKYYFQADSKKKQFFGKNKDGKLAILFSVSSVKIRRHTKIKGDANPFDPEWEVYFEERQDKKMMQSTSGKLRKLYERQEGKCLVCQTKITKESGWNTHHVVAKHLGGSDNLSNLQLLHPNCHRQLHYKKGLSDQPQQTENQFVVS